LQEEFLNIQSCGVELQCSAQLPGSLGDVKLGRLPNLQNCY
jgi:hypothetical protein